MTSRYSFSRTVFQLGMLVLLAAGLNPGWAATKTKATVIDFFGNRHELENIKILGKAHVEYYEASIRRIVQITDVERLRFDGERGDEERPLRVEFRDGRVETGTIVVGSDATPHHESVGGGRLSSQISGSTSLGPFLLHLGDVREIIFEHPESSRPSVRKHLAATLVDEEGTMYDVGDLNFRETTNLVFSQGRKRRSIDMSQIAKIAFAEASSGQEQRPITVTLWSGQNVQGNVEAGRARYAGETDRMFHRRVGSAFTGKTGSGRFAIGLHNVRLVMFKPAAETPEEAGATGNAGADSAGFQETQSPD